MTSALRMLLEGNRDHVAEIDASSAGLRADHLPEVVSLSCPDARVSQEGMFAVDRPGWLFTPSSIGNQVWDRVDGETVVDGSLLYPLHQTDTQIVLVVGHTGCGALTAAYEAAQGEASNLPAGTAKRIALLAPVVSQALADGVVDTDAEREAVIDQLVEVNVREQVAFLLDSAEIPEDVDVYGFVYDLTGAYGGPQGRTYLVDANGERDADRLRELVPGELADHVASLLD